MKKAANKKILIIRFSSFGDIVQAMAAAAALKEWPGASVEWLTKREFSPLLVAQPNVDRVISFDKKLGLIGLVRLTWHLANRDFTHVYDAHNNIRSRIVILTLRVYSFLDSRHKRFQFVRRPKDRLRRLLLFKFRWNLFSKPFRGAESFVEPLLHWDAKLKLPQTSVFAPDSGIDPEIQRLLNALPRPWVALAPSAAWAMKRWPSEHWQSLVRNWQEITFVCLGGAEDRFIAEIVNVAPERCVNLAGRIALNHNAAVIEQSDLLIANDTGLLHLGDQMHHPTLALIGPTAFGYPSHETSQVVELELACKPCSKDGRGRCHNAVYQRCLVELTPEVVMLQAKKMLRRKPQ